MVGQPAPEVVAQGKGRGVVLANPAMALHVVMVKGRPLAATEVANRLLMAVVVRRNVPRIATPIRRSSLTATSNHHEKARQMTGFCLLVTAHCALN